MKALPIVAAALLGLGLTSSSWADASAAGTPAVTPIALGCGIGRTRDASGRCRHRFNLFRHHGRFRAFKSNHCSKVTTPNGPVDRCRI